VKSRSIIVAFLPLIVFSVMARFLPASSIGIAGVAAAAVALLVMLTSRPVWPPKILLCCSFVVFAVFAVLGIVTGRNEERWLGSWGGAGVALVLGLIILALIPLLPFTEQFARESVPRDRWSSPNFKQINKVLSTAWGLAICALGVSRILAVAINGNTTRRLPEVLLGIVVPVLILVYMLKFTKSYPEKVLHAPPDAAGTVPGSLT
jgi:hypothetical protein